MRPGCSLRAWVPCRSRPLTWHLARRGEVSDYVLMEGRGFGFVTYADAQHAQQFLEVRGSLLL